MKAFYSLMAALCLLLSLVACSGKENLFSAANTSTGGGAGSEKRSGENSGDNQGKTASSAEKKQNGKPQSNKLSPKQQQELLNKELISLVHNYDGHGLDKRLQKIRQVIKSGANVNAYNAFGESILSDAVHYGDGKSDDIRVVELLLSSGADVNRTVSKSKRTPLSKAAEAGNLPAVRLLMQYKKTMPENAMVHALVNAAYHRHQNVVNYLIDNGAVADASYREALRTAPTEAVKAWAVLAGKYADQKAVFYRSIVEKNQSYSVANYSDEVQAIHAACGITESELGDIHLQRQAPIENIWAVSSCEQFDELYSRQWKHCYMMLKSKYTGVDQLEAQLADSMAKNHELAKSLTKKKASTMTATQVLTKIDAMQFALDVQSNVLNSNKRKRKIINWHKDRNRFVRRYARDCNVPTTYLALRVMNKSLTRLLRKLEDDEDRIQAERSALKQAHGWLRTQLPALKTFQ